MAHAAAATVSAGTFDLTATLHELHHLLPGQAPLKDFIHHNTLHGFQHLPFFEGTQRAAEMFGYNVSLTIPQYRAHCASGRISAEMLDQVIVRRYGASALPLWRERTLRTDYPGPARPRIGLLRAFWKHFDRVDLDSVVHPVLFRLLGAYLDQGISIWKFPFPDQPLLTGVRLLEQGAFTSFFRGRRAPKILAENRPAEALIPFLLKLIVGGEAGDEALYAQYLFDQQFAHPGWSGMVAAVESQPQTLLDRRPAKLVDLIALELLFELDALDFHAGNTDWMPLARRMGDHDVTDLFAPTPADERGEVLRLWQEAYEWSYYDDVLAGLRRGNAAQVAPETARRSFQAMFCIDDRECSFRRYLEALDPLVATYGTPGFFGVEFYFQPAAGRFYEKVCPAPLSPNYLIKELDTPARRETDAHFSKHAHSLHSGFLISQTLGFWAAARLVANLFRPQMNAGAASSFKHMSPAGRLTIAHDPASAPENGLQVGFNLDEMTQRVEALLRSIGLVSAFAPLVYVVGHGASSANNPHYAAYDCGACSGRAGSVNSRVISWMANHPPVRERLRARGIDIPDDTRFVGALHDTTRDEMAFFDLDALPEPLAALHRQHADTFDRALDLNAKERSRRFVSIDTHQAPAVIHDLIRTRSVSLFEPRPELNHATNALCIVGRRPLTQGVLLDRRAFLNSYDYAIDPSGDLLFNILKAAAPVCGGINLEYYFSRVDNQKLGAGTKLPHNVMGLFGVANGADGDLRPGLPSQMIEVHDPVRLLLIVEQKPEVVLQVIQRTAATYEWFQNEWVNLVVADPETGALFRFANEAMVPYQPARAHLPRVGDLTKLVEDEAENLPVLALG